MSIFCSGLSLSTGQSNTLVLAGLERVDQEFGARRIQVRNKGAVREGEQAAGVTAASQAERRKKRAGPERDSNRSLPGKEPSGHCMVLVLASLQHRGSRNTAAPSFWSRNEKTHFPHPAPSELRIKGASQFPL